MADLTDLEKQIQPEYFSRYKADPVDISRNHATNFYNLFEADFSNQQAVIPHFDRVNSEDSFGKATEKLQYLPQGIQNILQLKDKTILDFGCGLGEFVNDAVNKYGANKAYGIDFASVEMGLTSKYESEKCLFMTGGASAINLPDNSVDILTAFLSLEHVHPENIDAMIGEFNRVCTGGYIFQISHGKLNKKNMRKSSHNFKWWYSKFLPYIGELYLFHLPKDNYKWGHPPNSGLTRWVCTLKDSK